jgi:iron complex transport system substrate-binding protein
MKLQIWHKIKYLEERMRIVSMVPSWTETLVESGANVVGRTRFCIHPSQKVKSIPILGGTKNWDLAKVAKAQPDWIVLDREENTAAMGEFPNTPLFVSHVRSVHDVSGEMRQMAQRFQRPHLTDLAERLDLVIKQIQRLDSVLELPSILHWIRKPEVPVEKIVYVIWKSPWMSVSQKTFIGSMLSLFLSPEILFDSTELYPQVKLESFSERSTLLLFSSEPYPFAKHLEEIRKLPFPAAVVDGESWSWFGLRSLRFLEALRTK